MARSEKEIIADYFRKLAKKRKASQRAGGRPVGYQKPGVARCACGKNTLARAKSRSFDCCRGAKIPQAAILRLLSSD